MKKLFCVCLCAVLLYLTACTGGDTEGTTAAKTTTQDAAAESNSISDAKTEAIEEYITNRTNNIYSLFVLRHTSDDGKIVVIFNMESVEVYKFGQTVLDYIAVTKKAFEHFNEKLSQVRINARYVNSNNISWTTINFEDGLLFDTINPDYNGGAVTIEDIAFRYSGGNSSLKIIDPREKRDYYEMEKINKNTVSDTLIEMSEHIHKYTKKSLCTVVYNGQYVSKKIKVDITTRRYSSEELGEIIQQAVEATIEAFAKTDRPLEQLSVYCAFFGDDGAKKTIEWVTDNFVDGYVWDDLNTDLFSPDGREMSYAEAISFYTPDNPDLK